MRTDSKLRVFVQVVFVGSVMITAAAGQLRGVEAPSSPVGAEELAKSVTIYRDAWGVPHIDGPTDESVVFGFAYAQAQDYFWQVEDSYVLAIGRYAELYGEKGFKSDVLNRAFEIPQRSREDYAKLDPEMKSLADAFVAGLNHYLDRHPEVKPRLITRFEPWQMLALGRQVILEMAYGNSGAPKDAVPTGYEMITKSQGSNAWAINGSRTKSGKPMLFCNPHQPYFGYGQFYEGHLRSGEGWNFTGATFFGGPLPTVGHNEHAGWSFTVNRPSVGSAWRVKFDDPANPLNYRHGDQIRTAIEWKDTIKVKKRKGFDERQITLRKTHHGPIVKQESDNVYIAAQVGKFNEALFSRQNLQMMRVKNLKEFREAMGLLDFHIFNTIYADRHGDIMFLYNGIVPKRDPGFDWERPVDGNDPRTDWLGIHTIDELPQIINPASGYVQSCNATPFTITDDGNGFVGDFPPYMVREKHDDKRRAQVSRMLLRKMNDVTFDQWQAAAFDTTIYWALTEFPKYRREWDRLRHTDPDLAARAEPYFSHLSNWDYKCSVDSTQATLCCAWYEKLYGELYGSETMVRQYVQNPGSKFQALIEAADGLKKTFGDWKIAWGDINRIQRHANVADFFQIPFSDDMPSVPSAGLPGPLGVVFNMYFTPTIELPPVKVIKKHYAVVGHSYVATVEFGDRIQGGSLTQFGSSGHPDSPHFMDQAQLVSERRFKPQLFYWEDVVSGCQEVYHPGDEAKAVAAQAAGK